MDQWVDRRMDQPPYGLLRWHPLVRPYLEVLAHWEINDLRYLVLVEGRLGPNARQHE